MMATALQTESSRCSSTLGYTNCEPLEDGVVFAATFMGMNQFK